MPFKNSLFFCDLDRFTTLVGAAAGAGMVGKNGFPAVRAGGKGRGRQALASSAFVPAGFGHFSLR